MTAQEQYHRLSRAVLLADLLQASGITASAVMLADAAFWALATEGVRRFAEFRGVPSTETQGLAVELLTRREEWAKAMGRTK